MKQLLVNVLPYFGVTFEGAHIFLLLHVIRVICPGVSLVVHLIQFQVQVKVLMSVFTTLSVLQILWTASKSRFSSFIFILATD